MLLRFRRSRLFFIVDRFACIEVREVPRNIDMVIKSCWISDIRLLKSFWYKGIKAL